MSLILLTVTVGNDVATNQMVVSTSFFILYFYLKGACYIFHLFINIMFCRLKKICMKFTVTKNILGKP